MGIVRRGNGSNYVNAIPQAVERERAGEHGSAAVEYVGLGLVVSMLMTAVASAIDSSMGEKVASAIVERLVAFVSG